ncbi:MAG: hypothetical protein MUO63_01555 [Desulfobulbaceae bacterium]|nr:hypothetical protein [Desulfobulbaceae bacterium]
MVGKLPRSGLLEPCNSPDPRALPFSRWQINSFLAGKLVADGRRAGDRQR